MDAAPGTTPQTHGREAERIHASAAVLILAAIGLTLWGVGRLAFYGPEGRVLCTLGLVLVAVALVLHVEHLTSRIGRSAVVLIILGVVVDALGNLLAAVGVSWSITWIVIGIGRVILGAGVVMVAVHKERQMSDALKDYEAGRPWQARETVRASFLSLITGAIGLILLGFGLMEQDFGSLRAANVLQIAGALLIAVGVISYAGRLAPRIGRAAVVVICLAVLFYAANGIPDVIDPDNAAAHEVFWHVCVGIAALLGALACLLVLARRRAQEDSQATQ